MNWRFEQHLWDKTPLFKKQEIKDYDVFISRCENSPYYSLANTWDIFSGLCEKWNRKLNRAEPLEATECWWLLPLEKG